MLKKFYDKSIELASNKRSNLYLGIVSFLKVLFPIPPDVMVVPMVLAKKSHIFEFFNCYSLFCSWRHFWLFDWLFVYRFSHVCH